MKKILLFVVLSASFLSAQLAAQEAAGGAAGTLLNVNAYAEYFGFTGGKIDYGNRYVVSTSDEDNDMYGNLGGEYLDMVDTPLEFALLSYYSQPVINIRPVEANAILPKNDPKTAGLRLGSALYKELLEIKFLTPNDTAAVGRYEGMLKFVSDKNGVTRAEIENYYRNGIRGLIAEVVDEQFNRISFMLDRKYNTVLTRNPQNQYVLSYERPSVENDDKTLSAASLEALSSAMSRSGDFSSSAINTVRDQAALLPAVVYADWKTKGVANGVDALALIKETLINFYLNPSQSSYNAILGIQARYWLNGGFTMGSFTYNARSALAETIYFLSPELRNKVSEEVNGITAADYARIPNDSRYNVFSTRR